MRFRPSRLVLSLVALCLLALLVVDLMQLARPSLLSAASCTTTLFRKKLDMHTLVVRYRDAIASQAERYGLPAELLAAIIVDHQAQHSSFGDFTDCFGSALGANLSLGLAQVRVSTAARVDGTLLEKLSPVRYRKLRAQLLEPESNINYAARELRSLRDRPIRFPGMSAQTLIHDPAAMALLTSEYRMGRLSTPSDKSKLNGNAFSTLKIIQNGTVDLFDRDASDRLGIQSTIVEYLGQIYCHSGLFNQSACEDWQRSQAKQASP